MSLVRTLLCFICLYLIVTLAGSSQFNLHHTDGASESSYKIVMQHDCLYAATVSTYRKEGPHHVIPYCLSEWPSKWKIKKNSRDQNFTFPELRVRNITSHQLYIWSAPMDLIERYQFYLDQSANSSETEMPTELFYNCTLPWFGPMCQYMFDQYETHHSSFAEMAYNFYHNRQEMSSLTCYILLQCNRATASMCLDWTDICNGIIDCIDGGRDEEHCWQLEVNDCQDNEYRCRNGQCIPEDFRRDDEMNPDCLDMSDERLSANKHSECSTLEPAFQCEEVTCRNSQFVDREFRTLASSSCVRERGKLLMQAMFSVKQNSVTDTCWLSLICIALTIHAIDNPICQNFCHNEVCKQLIEENCPDLILLPAVSLLFGNVYLVYTNKTIKYSVGIMLPDYVCYSDQLCSEMPTNVTLLSLNNATCRRYHELPYPLTNVAYEWGTIVDHVQSLFRTCTLIGNDYSIFCNMSTMYRCFRSSRCISIHRLNDGIRDCYHDDDENFVVTEEGSRLKPFKDCYKCQQSNKCISRYFLNDGLPQCPHGDDERMGYETREHISFQTICDGFTELPPVMIDERNETDETECEQWPCINTYTRCNRFWNCLNGADELNCDTLLRSNCTSDQHTCVSPTTNQLMCLPVEQANDGINDCLGATDEPRACRGTQLQYSTRSFYCQNNDGNPCIRDFEVCSGYDACIYGEDEQSCEPRDYGRTCYEEDLPFVSDPKLFFCLRVTDLWKRVEVFFSLNRASHSIRQIDTPKRKKRTLLQSSPMTQTNSQRQQICHHGLDMRVWLGSDENSTTITCLCPPNYYGNMCQYQNQRVSLTMQIKAPSDAWRTDFAFVASIIDNDERMIHSHELFNYLSARDCQQKINIYLLYSTRPKNETKHYLIHIDAYEKESLIHRASWLIPLTFPFLPVHRTIARLMIPARSDKGDICSDHQCVHGQCIKYTNNNTIAISFCQCKQGWTGRYCSIPYTCTCANSSLCVGVSAKNRSICVCPLAKFGARCLLDNTVCQSTSCHNGGKCVAVDERIAPHNWFSCICPKGFSGIACEIVNTKINVSFEEDIILSQAMLVHFIQVLNNESPARVTTFKKIFIGQNSATIYWPHPFHIMFIEISKNIYYLTVVQKTYVASTTLVSTINPSHRCSHISELFNETFVKLHLLRRIKYYHIPCQNRSLQLSCFYDDIHLCLCTDFEQQRVANCFEFDHHMKHDCIGQSVCQNGAQCFQDDSRCPQTSMCMCTECFYGTRCQFTTTGFGLSLDAILGYHIRPHVTLRHQPTIVQVSMALTIIMFVLGLLNGVLSIITFKVKTLREVGCGFYLMGSSITSILTVTIFTLKFWLLVLSQMALITNRSFLHVQCISMDFLIRICLSMDQWLNACVAIERAATAMHGVKFNKKTSRRVAKWVILVLSLLTISTAIHDPIRRQLIDDDDDEEQRTWCIVTYSTNFEVFNSAVNIVHFLVPFFINVISAIAIIMAGARQRARARPRQTYQQHLSEQFQQHKQLLIGPCVLIILAFPRLYISFISSCMKSARGPWLFLIGYFIAFVPPMLTFCVFVIPSGLYKEEFHKSIKQYGKAIRQRLRLNL